MTLLLMTAGPALSHMEDAAGILPCCGLHPAEVIAPNRRQAWLGAATPHWGLDEIDRAGWLAGVQWRVSRVSAFEIQLTIPAPHRYWRSTSTLDIGYRRATAFGGWVAAGIRDLHVDGDDGPAVGLGYLAQKQLADSEISGGIELRLGHTANRDSQIVLLIEGRRPWGSGHSSYIRIVTAQMLLGGQLPAIRAGPALRLGLWNGATLNAIAEVGLNGGVDDLRITSWIDIVD